jgi:transcription initiation factor TFIIH subunit 1
MATPSASASYKKKDGTLTVSKDHKSISWIPAAGGAGSAVTVSVQNMTSTYPSFMTAQLGGGDNLFGD